MIHSANGAADDVSSQDGNYNRSETKSHFDHSNPLLVLTFSVLDAVVLMSN